MEWSANRNLMEYIEWTNCCDDYYLYIPQFTGFISRLYAHGELNIQWKMLAMILGD